MLCLQRETERESTEPALNTEPLNQWSIAQDSVAFTSIVLCLMPSLLNATTCTHTVTYNISVAWIESRLRYKGINFWKWIVHLEWARRDSDVLGQPPGRLTTNYTKQLFSWSENTNRAHYWPIQQIYWINNVLYSFGFVLISESMSKFNYNYYTLADMCHWMSNSLIIVSNVCDFCSNRLWIAINIVREWNTNEIIVINGDSIVISIPKLLLL